MSTSKQVFDEYGNEWWYNEEGHLHREDGPAARLNGFGGESWHLNGKYHRVGGPAVTYENGETVWYLHDKYYHDPAEYCDVAGITGRDKTLFLLKYSKL